MKKRVLIIACLLCLSFGLGACDRDSARLEYELKLIKAKNEQLKEELEITRMINKSKLTAAHKLLDTFPPVIDNLTVQNGMLNQKLQEVTLLLNKAQKENTKLIKGKKKLSVLNDKLVESKGKLVESVALLVTKSVNCIQEKQKVLKELTELKKKLKTK